MYGGVPAKEVQRSDQLSDVSQQAGSSDLLVNNLSYHQPEALSLAVSRTYSRQYFQRANYLPGETAVIDFNAGTDFVDPGNSYITFVVSLSQTGGTDTGTNIGFSFGVGSAMNLIRQVTIRSRSGTELDRVELANLWSLYNTVYTESDAYLSRQGLSEGFAASRVADFKNSLQMRTTAITTAGSSGANGYRFVLPLKRLAPFFNPIKKGQKVPPQLMSGLHMEIIWEAPGQAIVLGGTNVTNVTAYTYAISQLAIMCDSVCMTDDVQKTINDQSAMDGLEYSYPRVFTSQTALGSGATTLNAQVRKAVSQANIAWTICLNAASQNHSTAAASQGLDPFAAMPWDITAFQYRLGALYYPMQAIQDPNQYGSGTGALSVVPSGIESYAQALETMDKFKHPHTESSVSLSDFVGRQAGSNSPGGYGVMAVSLEKDTSLNFSGLPVNNSRVLEVLNTTFPAGSQNVDAGSPVTRLFVTFLEYSAVARSYVDNTAVSI